MWLVPSNPFLLSFIWLASQQLDQREAIGFRRVRPSSSCVLEGPNGSLQITVREMCACICGETRTQAVVPVPVVNPQCLVRL